MDEPNEFPMPDFSDAVSPEMEEALLADDSWDWRDEESLAQLDAGLFVSHEAVGQWLDDFSNGIRRPPPRPGE